MHPNPRSSTPLGGARTSVLRASSTTLAFALAIATALSAQGAAHAQAAGSDAAAEALFRDGRQLMEQGRFAEACSRFEASYRIDVAVGTLLNLADCLERDGRLASAWAKFLEAASHAARTGNAAREQIARQRASALEPRLVRGRFVVAHPVPGLVLRVSGQEMPEATWSVPIPVDPGRWAVEATAPGYLPWRQEYPATVEGSVVEIDVPELAVDQAAVAAAEEERRRAEAEAEAARADAASRATASSGGSGARTAAFITGGVGLAALGGALGFTLHARSLWNDANCPGNICVTPADQTDAEDARSQANLATGLTIGGGAMLATSVVLFIVAPSRGSSEDSAGVHVFVSPVVDATSAGLVARGTF